MNTMDEQDLSELAKLGMEMGWRGKDSHLTLSQYLTQEFVRLRRIENDRIKDSVDMLGSPPDSDWGLDVSRLPKTTIVFQEVASILNDIALGYEALNGETRRRMLDRINLLKSQVYKL